MIFKKKSTFAPMFLIMKKIVGFLSFIFSLVILFSCEPGRDDNGDLLFGITPSKDTMKLLEQNTVPDSSFSISTFPHTHSVLNSGSVKESGKQGDISLK